MNPNGSYLQNWNKFVLILSIVALAMDPLFFYIPEVSPMDYCQIREDNWLKVIAIMSRTVMDALYVVHMVFQFRTGFIAPSSRGFGKGELITDFKKIAIRYLTTYFLIDLLSILPLPQLVLLHFGPNASQDNPLDENELLKWVIFCQYVPRIVRIFPLSRKVTRTSGLVTETAWAGAVLNLFLYMLASHVLGAFWYLISIERIETCWKQVCANTEGCNYVISRCHITASGIYEKLNSFCPLINPEENSNSTVFNFGIFASQSELWELKTFTKKLLYCFWWGLRNLSALGQNLKTSSYEGEILFAAAICAAGLVLFALLIGNMQKYLQSTTVRVEEMRVKKRDAEKWMSHRMLPDDLRKRIRKYDQCKWQQTRGVEEETILSRLPKDLRKDIKHHLCFNLVKKMSWFKVMDDLLLDSLCVRLKTVLYTEKSYIVHEGEPVEEMLFIMSGKLTSTTTYDSKTGFLNSVNLYAGDFSGDLLMTWAMDPNSSDNFPIASTNVQAQSDVEGFVISAKELKFVAAQYLRLHRKQARNMFRYYSVKWRTWATCFIQVTCKRHCRRKLLKALREEESKLHYNTIQNDDSGGSNTLASTTLKNLRTNDAAATKIRFAMIFFLLPQKPTDPKFLMGDK